MHCRSPYELDAKTAARFELESGLTLYRPEGCKECRHSGYKGRVGVFEVIRITSDLADLIQRGATLSELRQSAVDQGMQLLSHSAMNKVSSGLSSLEEALAVTVAQD